MAKIFLLLNPTDDKDKVIKILKRQNYEIMEACGKLEDILTQINNYDPDIIITEGGIYNCEYTLSQIKSTIKNHNTQILMLLDGLASSECLTYAEGFVEMPVQQEVLLQVISSHLKIRKSLDRLFDNNKELSRSLYQLNVLYNTSSQFAGTLNTNKLYEIMIEAMEKTLSFDISSVLLFKSPKEPVFNLNTIHAPSDNLIDALKIRSILNYESLFDKNSHLKYHSFENIEIVQKTKQARSNKVFGLESVSFDSLFAPIKVGDEIFGVVELFRQTPFAQEDVTCFQAITHQVALPLRSAKLYEEISNTNKKLEKLEKLKSEFISIVSHELRTPLTPINNSLEIVLSGQAGEISPDVENFVSMAKRNIQRLAGIIEDLLDLSRLQAGKLDFKYKKVDITPSLELLKNTFSQVASEKNININLSIINKLPEIYADTRRIEQIFSNLVSNSIKFTKENGEIAISATVVESDEIISEKLIQSVIKPEGKYIQVCVEDNGIGMKKEDIPIIFDKFSQIESSLNRNKGGVGLGLTITKQLIDSHLGAISVKSEEKKGSRFSVILPLYDIKKVFRMDLLHALTKSEKVGIVNIVANKEITLNGKNVVEILKENKLINITSHSKELFVGEEDFIDYYFFMSEISTDSFNALLNTLDEHIDKLKDENHDIILRGAHSAIDVDKVYNIVENL